jgi:inner membrane protein
VSDRPDLSLLGSIWDRIWEPSVSLATVMENGVCANRKINEIKLKNT